CRPCGVGGPDDGTVADRRGASECGLAARATLLLSNRTGWPLDGMDPWGSAHRTAPYVRAAAMVPWAPRLGGAADWGWPANSARGGRRDVPTVGMVRGPASAAGAAAVAGAAGGDGAADPAGDRQARRRRL